jgi:predicted thioesterase
MNINDTGKATLLICEDDSAKAIAIDEGDEFPDVFSTSRMIALMEIAAARAMRHLCGEGELSVGIDGRVRHIAATPIGSAVDAEATFLGMRGKLFLFRVQAYDEGGIVGEGEHTRAIVTTDYDRPARHRRLHASGRWSHAGHHPRRRSG